MNIYIDGGFHPKFKKGAFAFIAEFPGYNVTSRGMINVNNSREAELFAAEKALNSINEPEICVYTDYQGLIDGIVNKNHSKEFSGILQAIGDRKVNFVHMQGHREQNKVVECDKLINEVWKSLKREEAAIIRNNGGKN